MKLLILTQKVDRDDPVLGFFHSWLEALAPHFDKLTVVCLEEGKHHLPDNVKVLSLGKETKPSRIRYIVYFYRYIWRERRNYDAVFVHMNQEYVLLGAKHWFFMRKPVYLWRNHAKGGFLTRLAGLLSRKVFYTSPSSFTATFSNAVQMPAGIDTDFFKPDWAVGRRPHSVLFLGRIAPVKKVLEFIEWFHTLDSSYTATIAGDALPQDRAYEKEVRQRAGDGVQCVGAVNRSEARRLYQSHEIYVNKTPAGSFDKTVLEAAACGAKVLVDNPDFKNLESMTSTEAREFVIARHSLSLLAVKLASELS